MQQHFLDSSGEYTERRNPFPSPRLCSSETIRIRRTAMRPPADVAKGFDCTVTREWMEETRFPLLHASAACVYMYVCMCVCVYVCKRVDVLMYTAKHS